MRNTQRIGTLALLALIGATIAGVLQTRQPAKVSPEHGQSAQIATSGAALVDQSSLKTAQQLASLAATPDERRLAQEALRVADHEVDLAFAEALRQAAEHPPVLSAEGRDIQIRLERAQKALRDDEARVV